jgi:hypothetical protein
VAHHPPGGEDNDEIDDLLLSPEEPLLSWEEERLETDGEGHGEREEQVLVVDQGEDV